MTNYILEEVNKERQIKSLNRIIWNDIIYFEILSFDLQKKLIIFLFLCYIFMECFSLLFLN